MTDAASSNSTPTPGRQPFRRRELFILAAILAAGLGLRIGYLCELVHTPDFADPVVDPEYHDYWARALVTGDWTPPPHASGDPLIPSTPYFRPPGYPYFLAAVYRVGGNSYYAPRIAQMLLGLANCVLAFLLARRWFGSEAGLFAAALMSGYWIFIYFEGELQEPVLLIFLLLLSTHVLALWAAHPRWYLPLLAGVLLGLAALVKPNPLLFLPFGVLWTWWVARRRRCRLGTYVCGLGLVLGAAIAIAPATIRNYVVDRDITLISANSGINLYIGNNEYAGGLFLRQIPGWGWFFTCYDYPRIVERTKEEVGRPLTYADVSSHYRGKALRFIRENPGRFAALTIRRCFLFWHPEEIAHNKVIDCERAASSVLAHLPGSFPFVLAVFLFGLGTLVYDANTEQRGPAARTLDAQTIEVSILLIALIAAFFLSYLFFFNAALYRVPLIPFLLLFGAYGISRVRQFARAANFRAAGFCVVVIAALYLLAGVQLVPYQSPGLAAWHGHRAKLFQRQGKPDQAERELRAAIGENPRALEGYILLADLQEGQGRVIEALETLQRGVRSTRGHPVIQCELGDLLLKLGRPEQAKAAYREALRYNPDYVKAREGLEAAMDADWRTRSRNPAGP